MHHSAVRPVANEESMQQSFSARSTSMPRSVRRVGSKCEATAVGCDDIIQSSILLSTSDVYPKIIQRPVATVIPIYNNRPDYNGSMTVSSFTHGSSTLYVFPRFHAYCVTTLSATNPTLSRILHSPLTKDDLSSLLSCGLLTHR